MCQMPLMTVGERGRVVRTGSSIEPDGGRRPRRRRRRCRCPGSRPPCQKPHGAVVPPRPVVVVAAVTEERQRAGAAETRPRAGPAVGPAAPPEVVVAVVAKRPISPNGSPLWNSPSFQPNQPCQPFQCCQSGPQPNQPGVLSQPLQSIQPCQSRWPSQFVKSVGAASARVGSAPSARLTSSRNRVMSSACGSSIAMPRRRLPTGSRRVDVVVPVEQPVGRGVRDQDVLAAAAERDVGVRRAGAARVDGVVRERVVVRASAPGAAGRASRPRRPSTPQPISSLDLLAIWSIWFEVELGLHQRRAAHWSQLRSPQRLLRLVRARRVRGRERAEARVGDRLAVEVVTFVESRLSSAWSRSLPAAAEQEVAVRAADEPVVAGVAEEHVLAVVDDRLRRRIVAGRTSSPRRS